MGDFIHAGKSRPDNQTQKHGGNAYGKRPHPEARATRQSRIHLAGKLDVVGRQAIERCVHGRKKSGIGLGLAGLFGCAAAAQALNGFRHGLTKTLVGLLDVIAAQQQFTQKGLGAAFLRLSLPLLFGAKRLHAGFSEAISRRHGGKIPLGHLTLFTPGVADDRWREPAHGGVALGLHSRHGRNGAFLRERPRRAKRRALPRQGRQKFTACFLSKKCAEVRLQRARGRGGGGCARNRGGCRGCARNRGRARGGGGGRRYGGRCLGRCFCLSVAGYGATRLRLPRRSGHVFRSGVLWSLMHITHSPLLAAPQRRVHVLPPRRFALNVRAGSATRRHAAHPS